jgi:hypothetical protein
MVREPAEEDRSSSTDVRHLWDYRGECGDILGVAVRTGFVGEYMPETVIWALFKGTQADTMRCLLSLDSFPRSHSLPMDVAKLYRLRGEPGSGTAVSHIPDHMLKGQSEADNLLPNSHTLLTCCFSHSNTGHIALNMLGLYFIGPATAG